MNLPEAVPVMIIPEATLFPQALLPLCVFEPRYQRMLADTLEGNRLFAVAMQRPDCLRETPCRIAGVGMIRVSVEHANGTSHLILQGLDRIELGPALQLKPYRIHSIRRLQTSATDSVRVDALLAKVQELVETRLELAPIALPPCQGKTYSKHLGPEPFKKTNPGAQSASAGSPAREILGYLRSLPEPGQVADLIACALLPRPDARQTILETLDLEDRLRHLIHFLMAEIKRLRKDSAP